MQQLVKNKEGKNISLSDAELRLQKQILRWVNKDSIDGYTDEAAISIIGMKGLKSGIYIVQIETDNGIETKKIIKK